MSQIIPIKIPTYISAADFAPARVLPRLFYYNGLIDCETYYIESGSLINSGVTKELNAFPYFDNYNVVTGSFPTVNSKSLLFTNEAAAYGEVPTDSLYTEYWSKYISLLYNPVTRLVACEAIIPLADYFKMELNDIVQWRGNYYHLRAINDYNLSNGECNLQLLGPILDDVIGSIIPELACSFDFSFAENLTPTTTIAPTTAVPTTTLTPTTATPTTTLVPCALAVDYLVVAGGGGGGFQGGGGAGGGVVSASVTLSSSIAYNVIVGNGGAGATTSVNGTNGETSSFNASIAYGGGGGGSDTNYGSNGANGGGSGYSTTYGLIISGGIGTSGFNGGLSFITGGAGGGAGASQNGGNAAHIDPFDTGSAYGSGRGGSGSQWLDGNYYAGGGGGGRITFNGFGNAGGIGGGGGHSTLGQAFTGSANTGGGGGGGTKVGSSDIRFGANGGSGVVIVRYSGVPQATGGTITQTGGYTYHTFTSGSNFLYIGAGCTTLTPTVTPTVTPTTTLTPTTLTPTTLTPTTATPTVTPTTTLEPLGNCYNFTFTAGSGTQTANYVLCDETTTTYTSVTAGTPLIVCCYEGRKGLTGGFSTITQGSGCTP